MKVFPIKVQETLQKLKGEHKHYVEIKVIDNLYCVFESKGIYDSKSKKTKKETHYLGIIRQDGTFAPSKHAKYKNQVVSELNQVTGEITADEDDRKLLTALSMNGRSTYSSLGKRIGISKNAAYHKVKDLEKRYGIRYFAEINTDKLGYLKFLTLIKFKDKIPQMTEIQEAIKTEPRIQLALVLNGGNYDLLIYVLAESNLEINKINVLLMRETILINYPAEWYITPFYQSSGQIPLKPEFLESLKQNNVKINPLLEQDESTNKKKQMLKREFVVLKELNNNGAMSFTDIDKRYGFDSGRAQYTYSKLIENGIINRITISMESVPMKYMAIFYLKIINYKKFESSRPEFLHSLIEYSKAPINKYTIITDIGVPYGVILFFPVFADSEIEKVNTELSQIGGITVNYSVVIKTIQGSICYRLLDNNHSKQKEILVERYGEKKPVLQDYNK